MGNDTDPLLIFPTYFVFGRLHVRFQSQSEVVRSFHQVLRGTDQDLVNRTRHRPRRLHQRTSLSRRERRKPTLMCPSLSI